MGWAWARSLTWALAVVLIATIIGTTTYCVNRDNNADALALCLQSNSATECASLFDNVDVEISK